MRDTLLGRALIHYNSAKLVKIAAKCAVLYCFVLKYPQFIIWNCSMKFRFLLWMLGRMMSKASKTNPAFQKQLDGKDLTFMLHTLDGKVARHFVVANNR